MRVQVVRDPVEPIRLGLTGRQGGKVCADALCKGIVVTLRCCFRIVKTRQQASCRNWMVWPQFTFEIVPRRSTRDQCWAGSLSAEVLPSRLSVQARITVPISGRPCDSCCDSGCFVFFEAVQILPLYDVDNIFE